MANILYDNITRSAYIFVKNNMAQKTKEKFLFTFIPVAEKHTCD